MSEFIKYPVRKSKRMTHKSQTDRSNRQQNSKPGVYSSSRGDWSSLIERAKKGNTFKWRVYNIQQRLTGERKAVSWVPD